MSMFPEWLSEGIGGTTVLLVENISVDIDADEVAVDINDHSYEFDVSSDDIQFTIEVE